MKPKQLKDLKATKKILESASTDIINGLNTLNNLCMNKIFPARGDYLIEFQRGMAPGAKRERDTLNVPRVVQINLFPIRDNLCIELNNLRGGVSELINMEKADKAFPELPEEKEPHER